MTNVITKVKLTKGRTLEVEMTEILDDHTENEVVKKCSQLAHDDLINVFDRLKVHMVKICRLHEGSELVPSEFNPENDLKDFSVSSFSISGTDEHEGVTLSGARKFDSGKVFNINTPFLKYSDEDDYMYASELAADIVACVHEAEEYLNGKYAIKQLEIDFEGTEETQEVDQTEKKPKRGKGKKIEMYIPEQAPAYAEM